MKVRVEIDRSAMDRAASLLSEIPDGMQTAMTQAFNRALREGRTAATRAVTKETTLKAKTVRPTFAMKKAKKSGLEAELKSEGPNQPLSNFTYRPRTDTTGKRRKEVRVAVRRGSLKPIGQGFVQNARVMQRVGKARLPVEQKYGPSVPGLVNDEAVVEKVTETIGEAVDKRLAHETRRLLNKS